MEKYSCFSIVFFAFLNVTFAQNIQKEVNDIIVSKTKEIEMKTLPERLAQQQLDAYNNGDIDAFLLPYADNVEVFDFPEKLNFTGKEKMKTGYESFFKANPKLNCELLNRIVLGNTVIDHELITGLTNGNTFKAVAIYKIENDAIAKVYFMRE